MCSAHPAKGDLKKFEGHTAEQEEYFQQCARAHLGAILFQDSKNFRFFSKQLMHFADPEFVPSPPSTPERNRKRRRPPARKAAAPTAPESPQSAREEEEDPPQNETRNLADMAAFWDDSDEDY